MRVVQQFEDGECDDKINKVVRRGIMVSYPFPKQETEASICYI